MIRVQVLLVSVAALVVVAFTPSPALAATCSDYPNQAAAQRAADTRDADGDGVYCESLPCPCLKPGQGGGSTPKPKAKPKRKSCTRTRGVVNVGFSKTRYPSIRDHMIAAVEAGWPRILVLNRPGADARRERLLDDPEHGLPPAAGYDRDEYPPAIGRGRGRKVLMQGVNPVGWIASVALVPSSENRSHGASMGIKLRRYCNGTRFRYVFF